MRSLLDAGVNGDIQIISTHDIHLFKTIALLKKVKKKKQFLRSPLGINQEKIRKTLIISSKKTKEICYLCLLDCAKYCT